MTFKQRVEASPVLSVLGAMAAGFAAAISIVTGGFKLFHLDVLPEGGYTRAEDVQKGYIRKEEVERLYLRREEALSQDKVNKFFVPKEECRQSIPKSSDKKAFDKLETELRLDGTIWKGEYEDVGETGAATTRSGSVDFHQYGSRIVGEGRDNGRTWLIEGIAYKSRLCYIYVDSDPNVVSIGTSSFQLNTAGNKLEGEWIGWAPDGTRFEPRRITLTKVR